MASGPVIASMRRTLAALEVSLTIRNMPISAVDADVRAAAQLTGEGSVPHLDHAHDIAVLLVEQRHRPEPLGLVQRRGEGAYGMALQDPAVDVVLDGGDLLGRHAAGVGEVKAQLVGTDVGAGLVDVIAQASPQRGVQQVRSRVIARGRVAHGAVDVRVHALAGRERPVLRRQGDDLIVAQTHDVDDRPPAAPALALQRADVGDLAAAGGVEG